MLQFVTVCSALGWLLAAALGALAVPLVRAGERSSSPAPPVVIRAGRLLDVRKGRLVEKACLLVREGKIAAVGPDVCRPVAMGAAVIDLSRATVLPGLIDSHTHLAWGSPETLQGPALAGADEARATLLAGFTTVRNLGSTGRADITLRKAIETGQVIGPRLLAAGPGLGVPGGVCDRVFQGEAAATSVAEVVRRVHELVESGTDVIKLCAGGPVLPSVANPGATEYSEEEIRAIVAEARKHGRKVAAHAQGPAAILNRPGPGWIRSNTAH